MAEANRYKTTGINEHVRYSFERQFCRQCAPGYLPDIVTSPSGGLILRPAGISGNWGTWRCISLVQAPYYADGCVIDFTKETGELAVNDPACSRPCQLGFATTEDGATSAAACEFDPSAVYHDATGDFTIGNMTCPTNGG